ncbi:MAG: squalene--hopene cyclase [Planctomycetaceae bacterium]|nr:squalene--hopene cyclase [Planctomycetaceae bacterium]
MKELPLIMRVGKAFQTVSDGLFSQCAENGWTGELSASALSTATAVSALSVYRNIFPQKESITDAHIEQGINYLLKNQNEDGGWGDTDKSISNISTSVLVKSAFILSGASIIPGNETVIQRADHYIEKEGGVEAVKQRYGKDNTFSVPILANAALAGLVRWENVPQLPFERAALPQSMFRLLNLHVVSYAIPALVAIGQVRFSFAPTREPFFYLLRKLSIKRTLRLIENMQPESGGYLEAVPLTAFTVMSLIAAGHSESNVVRSGIRFLNYSIREDGSWAIDTNLALWTTTLSVNALGREHLGSRKLLPLAKYILACQHKERHPFTGAEPGGWGWTHLSGAVPDADDTAGALLALTELFPIIKNAKVSSEIITACIAGIQWLLKLQNADGGIPTFCRGWGILPFDKSSPDITAHCLRAFSTLLQSDALTTELSKHPAWNNSLKRKMSVSMKAMHTFLRAAQQQNGSWIPLWFGNQYLPDDANPFYGTAKVISALCSYRCENQTMQEETNDMLRSGIDYLLNTQNHDGGWGAKPEERGNKTPDDKTQFVSTIEETALVTEALAHFMKHPQAKNTEKIDSFYRSGIKFLVEQVENGDWQKPSPIGLYFAKLWYYEKLYPQIFTAAALRTALD